MLIFATDVQHPKNDLAGFPSLCDVQVSNLLWRQTGVEKKERDFHQGIHHGYRTCTQDGCVETASVCKVTWNPERQSTSQKLVSGPTGGFFVSKRQACQAFGFKLRAPRHDGHQGLRQGGMGFSSSNWVVVTQLPSPHTRGSRLEDIDLAGASCWGSTQRAPTSFSDPLLAASTDS